MNKQIDNNNNNSIVANNMEENNLEDEIDLIEIAQKLWKSRKLIITITVAFALLGLFIALFTPNVYTASCTMVPQTGEKSAGGSLGGLAAMAGINLGSLSSGEVLSPNVYPKIVSNVNFQKEIIYSKYQFKDVVEPITLYDYYTDNQYQKFNLLKTIKKYTIGLPGVILKALKGKTLESGNSYHTSIEELSQKELQVVKSLEKNLTLDVNPKDGYITLNSNMNEPYAAAQLAQKGQELLQKYITEFKIEKVTSNLEFVEKNHQEAKLNFETKQNQLARFRDANKSFVSEMARTQEEKLTAEYNLLLSIYTELAKQKEQAKIAVTETTPILTIIEPVVIPNEKSKPSRAAMLFIYTFLGAIIGIGYTLTIPFLKETYQKVITK